MATKLYFNDKERPELTERIFELIHKAQKYIKTGNFFFKDPKINEALREASRRGVAVFILSNLTGNENRGNIKTNNDIEVSPHIPHLHELHREGAHVHISNDLHAKFFICDGQEGLIMSANYTIDSLYGNPENGVDVNGNELKDLEYIFDKMYMNPDVILSEDGKSYRYMQVTSPLPSNTFSEIGKNSRLLLTAASKNCTNLKECKYKTIYEKMLKLVDSAERVVIIVSWSYNQVFKLKELKDALQRAIERGVIVNLYYGTKASDWRVEETCSQISKLIGREYVGSHSRAFKDNHAKCVVTEKEGIMFTANIDGKLGLLSGFELGCILTEEQRIYCINRIGQIINNGK